MKLTRLSFVALLLLYPLLGRADVGHELSFGGGVSLMNVSEAGVGYGASVGYRVSPVLPIPLGVALDVGAMRWDTAKTGDGNHNLFGEDKFVSQFPTSLSLISFVIRVDYHVVDESLWFLAPALGWGQAITAETRRDATPTAGQEPITTDTQIRMVFSLGADVGFKLNQSAQLIFRPQISFVNNRNLIAPLFILAARL